MHLFQLVRTSAITEELFGGENHFIGRADFRKVGEAAGQPVGSRSSFAGSIGVQQNIADPTRILVTFISKNITDFQGTISLTLASGPTGELNDTFDLDFGAPPPSKIVNGGATKPAGCRLTWAAPIITIAGLSFPVGVRQIGDCSCVRLQIFSGLPNTRYSFANIHTSGVAKRADAVTDANGNFDAFSDTPVDSSFVLGDWQVRLIGPGTDVLCGGFRIGTEQQDIVPREPLPGPIGECPPGTRTIPGAPQLGCVPIEIPKPETCPEGQIILGRNPDGSVLCGTKAELPPIVLPSPGVECGTGEIFDLISGRCVMSVPPVEPPGPNGVKCEPGTVLGPGGECIIEGDVAPPATDKRGLGILALVLIGLVAIGGEK